MGEVIRFVPKSERERARLIREARAIYHSIFPPADPVSGKRVQTAGWTTADAVEATSNGEPPPAGMLEKLTVVFVGSARMIPIRAITG
jgi:hypothetical protein